MAALDIRPYAAADRQAVHRIAADTAFFGEPAEAFLDDRRVFTDAFYAYYTDQEPEHAWIACADGEVAGFLMGCVDTRSRERFWRRDILWAAGRAAVGHYRLGRRTWRFATAFGLAMLRRGEPPVDLSLYPAHLHINLDARYRGLGLGRRLIEAYLDQLCSLGVSGVHLNTTNLNEAACRLYEKVGFRLLAARPTRIWAGFTDQPVESRCYGLQLSRCSHSPSGHHLSPQ
jgi:ribosomal protein S18 acetylase RimI-like enzyme